MVHKTRRGTRSFIWSVPPPWPAGSWTRACHLMQSKTTARPRSSTRRCQRMFGLLLNRNCWTTGCRPLRQMVRAGEGAAGAAFDNGMRVIHPRIGSAVLLLPAFVRAPEGPGRVPVRRFPLLIHALALTETADSCLTAPEGVSSNRQLVAACFSMGSTSSGSWRSFLKKAVAPSPSVPRRTQFRQSPASPWTAFAFEWCRVGQREPGRSRVVTGALGSPSVENETEDTFGCCVGKALHRPKVFAYNGPEEIMLTINQLPCPGWLRCPKGTGPLPLRLGAHGVQRSLPVEAVGVPVTSSDPVTS